MAMAAAIPTTDQALEFAVRSIRKADTETGKEALRWVLKREPTNVSAWLWLGRCVEDQVFRAKCVDQVATLNPFA
jgi:hypothetical protein